MSGDDVAARSNVYLNEYTELMTSNVPKKLPFTRKTKLTADDFIKNSLETEDRCSCLNVEDKDVEMLVNQFQKKDFTLAPYQDTNIVVKQDSNEVEMVQQSISRKDKNRKLSGNEEVQDPIKKPKIMEPSNDNKLIDVRQKSKPNIPNPWKSENNVVSSQSSVAKTSMENPFISSQHPFKAQPISNPFKRDKVLSDRATLKPNAITNPWKDERKASPQKNSEVRSKFSNLQRFNQKPIDRNTPKIDEPVVKKSHENEDSNQQKNPFAQFKTGRQELEWQKIQQNQPKLRGLTRNNNNNNRATSAISNDDDKGDNPLRKKYQCPSASTGKTLSQSSNSSDAENPLLKGFDKAIIERIEREIVLNATEVTWNDIVGLDNAKRLIDEAITMAIKHPEYFTGLRETPRAIFLFGPPGNISLNWHK